MTTNIVTENDLFRGSQSLSRVIDCDAAPFCPDGWEVVDHRPDGQLEFDPNKIEFYLDEEQGNGGRIVGNEMLKRLEGKSVLNANVLDHLMANPQLIPDSWKKDADGSTRYIYFWGTVYRSSAGSLCVRCLYWDDDRWDWGYDWLGNGWGARRLAAVSAS